MDITKVHADPVRTATKYPGYWAIKKLRRRLRNRINAWLTHEGIRPTLTPLDPATIRRVIVYRRNNRLGNTLMLVPLLRSLHRALPQATIDVLIGNPGYISLLQGLPGVRQILALPSRGGFYPLRILQLLRQLRAQDYELCIEPTLNSLSNRLLAKLSGARQQIGFQTADQWLDLTHSVIPDRAIQHEALKSLQLIRQGIACPAPVYPDPKLEFNAAELRAGTARLHAELGSLGSGPIIGFCTQATGKKQLPRDWWTAWLNSLRQSGKSFRLLQILPPGAMPPLEPDLHFLREPDHRRLAAVMHGLDLFVSGDAGPMHLAAAAGTPTIGLFHVTDHHRYEPLGSNCLGLDIKTCTPAQVAQTVLHHLVPVIPSVSSRPLLAIRKHAEHAAPKAHHVDRQQYIPADKR